MKRVLSLLLIVASISGLAAAPMQALAQEPPEEPAIPADKILISELQTGGHQSAKEEFIELYNPGGKEVAIDGWQLYKSASGGSWQTKFTAPQAATIKPHHHYLIVTEEFQPDGINDSLPKFNAGLSGNGYLCLVKPGGNNKICDTTSDERISDLVGWGQEDDPLGLAAQAPQNGQSITRCSVGGVIIDTPDNAEDFIVSERPTPGYGTECPPEDEEPPAAGSTCEGVRISEILPNAAGSDKDSEFIELYNPTTSPILLDGCGLAVNNSEIYWFGDDIELAPEQYIAFYDNQTGLTLPNAAGGTVYLLSHSEEELHEVIYASNLDDDVAWAWVEDELWEQTYSPTPNTLNIRQPFKPCPEGQERSEDTGRCRSISGNESALATCTEGRERNPETNRCRKVDSGSGLKPCAPDQERNPATNRCRKIGQTSDLKPCKPDQERSPETNRCRKVAAASTSDNSNIHDIQAVQEGNPYRWWIAVGAMAALLAYAVFEWRRDIANLFRKYTVKS